MNRTLFHLFNESGVPVPFDSDTLESILNIIEERENCIFKEIEVVFVDDQQIFEMNRTYLKHDHITDVITFPYHDAGESKLEGTLFCCAPQIRRQSNEYGTDFENELKRVVIHGLLHLVGYNDDSTEAQIKMRNLEDSYITLYQEK